jgi:cytochrome c peroxidase
METYFQFDGGSCMACHQISNAEGRDFVMFVTMDAFRPGTPTAADLFAEKAQVAALAGRAPSLDSDPVVGALSNFFEAAEGK